VASGADTTVDGLRNHDALQLQSAGYQRVPYERLNPYVFEPPLAPHIAAARAGTEIDFAHIADCLDALRAESDFVVVEGVGGWLVPLGREGAVADLVERLDLPVVLVVGMRLGCLNHAQLTVESIARRHINLVAWVANRLDPSMRCFEENFRSLQALLQVPCLGAIPYVPERSAVPIEPGLLAGAIDVLAFGGAFRSGEKG